MEVGATLQLLYKHVDVLATGEVETSRLLSRECYERWLATRNPKPKQPEEAFRKILAAHCTAGSGMQPFSQAVEKSLLKLLRRKRVWECFTGTSCKIGLRGFKATGYWEKQAGHLLKIPAIKTKTKGCRLDHRRLMKHRSQELSCDEESITSADYRLSKELFLSIATSNSEEGKSMANIYKLLFHYQSAELAQLFVVISYKRGWMQKISNQCSCFKNDEKTKFFLTKQFIYPHSGDRYFDQNLKIGTSFGNIAFMKSAFADKNMEEIYKGSIVGKSLLALRVFPQHATLYQDHVLSDLFQKGEGWCRRLDFDFDGKPIVLLNRYTLLQSSSNVAVCQSQNITHKYAHLLG